MLSEKDYLLNLCTQYQLNQFVTAKVLEFGAESVLKNKRWMSQLQRYSVGLNSQVSKSISTITYLDSRWPGKLYDLDDEMPLILWFQTKSTTINHFTPAIAITGTKIASLTDVKFLGQITRKYSQQELSLVSDGSPGISELSLRLGQSGLIPFTLISNKGLTPRSWPITIEVRPDDFASVISELPIGCRTNRERTLRRNRIIAALSDLVIAIRPQPKSGASSILNWANQLGREVLEI